MEQIIGLIIAISAFSIPILIIFLTHRQKIQSIKIREKELQKEILELEIEKQNSKIKALEEENKKLDKIIFNEKIDVTNI
jgi:uncharacterized membrane protein (DUF106 family)